MDLPALGRPMSTTGTPSFKANPVANDRRRAATRAAISSKSVRKAERSANSTSSSLKSNSSSTKEANSTRRARKAAISLETPPRNCRHAKPWEALFSAAIRSATASA